MAQVGPPSRDKEKAQQDYDAALALKNEGNAAFKAKDYKTALKKYSYMFMYLGMNPSFNMSQMTGGAPPPASMAASQSNKDPLERKTDELRLTAFNNCALVFQKMERWEECKEKCDSVLNSDPNNQKALFRRAKAYRHLVLYDLADADLKKLKALKKGVHDKTIENEFKLLKRDKKLAKKEFLKAMSKGFAKDNAKKQRRAKARKEREAAAAKAKADAEKKEKENDDEEDSEKKDSKQKKEDDGSGNATQESPSSSSTATKKVVDPDDKSQIQTTVSDKFNWGTDDNEDDGAGQENNAGKEDTGKSDDKEVAADHEKPSSEPVPPVSSSDDPPSPETDESAGKDDKPIQF